MTLGKYLKNCRQQSKVTQAELADYLGYHPQFISNCERDLARPPLPSILDWVKYVGARKRKVKQILIEDYEKKISKFI